MCGDDKTVYVGEDISEVKRLRCVVGRRRFWVNVRFYPLQQEVAAEVVEVEVHFQHNVSRGTYASLATVAHLISEVDAIRMALQDSQHTCFPLSALGQAEDKGCLPL